MGKKSVLIVELIMFIILTFIIYLYDLEIARWIVSFRNNILDYIFLSVTFASNAFIIFFFLTSLFLWKEHKRKWIAPLWFASFFSFITSYLLKVLIARPRPFQNGISVLKIAFYFMKDNFLTWNFSFPSFQAMLVFSALPILNKEFKKFRYIWLVFACLVAFSRVYFGVHYLSDVLVGGAVGFIIGSLIVLIEEKHGYGRKIMKKIGLLS